MLSLLVFLSSILALYFLSKDEKKVFLYVIIPSIFLLPSVFTYNSNLPVPGITFYIAAMSVLSVYLFIFKFKDLRFNMIDSLIVIYIFMMFIIGLYKGETGYSIKLLQTNVLNIYLLYSVSKYFFKSNFMIKKSLDIISMCCLILLIFFPIETFGANYIIKYFWTGDYPFFQQAPRWGINRIQLFFSHPIIAGIIYSCISIYGLYSILYYKKNRKIYMTFLVLGFLGTALSISRGPFVFLIMFYGFILFKNLKSRMKWLLLILGLIIIVFLNMDLIGTTSVDSSIGYRLNLITEAKELIGGSPWVGYGGEIKYKGNVGYDWAGSGYMTIDNFYLYKTFSEGVVSLGLFLLIIISSLCHYGKLKANLVLKKTDRFFLDIAMFIITLIMLNYITVANMYHTNFLLYIMLAIISAKYENYKSIKIVEGEYSFKRIV